MNGIKRAFGALCLFALIAGLLGACGKGESAPDEVQTRIVCTIFPLYDWTRQILGDPAQDAELKLLLDKGVDMHSYQPTVDDIMAISNCDLFVYVGGESDKWVTDALTEAANPDLRAIALLDVLGEAVREEEITEGMQGEEGEDGGETDQGENRETEYDEHIWLSLKNAQICCDAIARALSALLPERAAVCAENLAAYQARLADLDARYEETARAASMKTLLCCDRFPFLYLAKDYGLSYYAAFPGCSAETEASFQTIVFLANQMDNLGLSRVLITESGDGRIARTVIDNTAAKNAQILRMDSMQSVSAKELSGGASYLDRMEKNLDVLREALA